MDVTARKKVEEAAAKRRSKIAKVKAASTTSGWLVDATTRKAHPVIAELRKWMTDAVMERNRHRDTAHIHPSEISKNHWCSRQITYRISDTPVDEDYKDGGTYWRLASIFEEGHHIHERHQAAFWEMGVLEGMWLCLDCRHRWWSVSPAVCERCASLHLTYREVPIEIPGYHIIGHTDGLHNDGERRINLEVKSIGIRSIEIEIPGVYKTWKDSGADLTALWSSIKIPFPSHQRQGLIYMAALNMMGYDVAETLYLYEFKANQELKGFVVKYDEKRALSLLNRAADILAAKEAGAVPDRPDWASTKHLDCKDCPWKDRCWNGVQAQENSA